MVKSYADKNGLRRGDFEKIVHLMDTDGTFVEDSAIVENVDTDRPQYYDDVIRCRNADVIIQRNAQKSEGNETSGCAAHRLGFHSLRAVLHVLQFGPRTV